MFRQTPARFIYSKLDPLLGMDKSISVVAIIETPTCHAIFTEAYDGKKVTVNALKVFTGRAYVLSGSIVDDRSGRFENIDYTDTAAAYADFNKLWAERIKWDVSNQHSTELDAFRAQVLSSKSILFGDIESEVNRAYDKVFHRFPDYQVLPAPPSCCGIM